MKKNIILVILMGLFITNIYAKDDPVITKELTVESFTGINVCCMVDVYLSEGQSSTVVVKADPEILSDLEIDVKNQVLDIRFKDQKNSFSDFFKKNKPRVSVYVSAQNLVLLKAEATGKIIGQTVLNAGDIKLEANATGSITADINAEKLNCRADSKGSITLNGKADYAKVAADSMGKVDMKNFEVSKADVKADSMGKVDITVKDNLKAHADSMGKVSYYGSPAVVDSSSDSMGSVKHKD